MKKIGGLIILLFCTVMVFSQPDKAEVETVEGKKYYVHFVQKGQTLYAIHQLYDVPVGDIARANDGLNDGLQIGQKVLIPIPVTNENHYKDHVVKSGETLYGISKQYKCSVSDIKNLNPNLDEAGIQIGEVLKVPNNDIPKVKLPEKEHIITDPKVEKQVYTTYSDSIIEHKVLKHETLYSISKRYMVTIASINELNDINRNKVKDGDVIKIKVKNVNYEIVENKIDVDSTSLLLIDTTFSLVKKEKYKIALFLPLMLSQNNGYMNKPIRAGEIQELFPITKISSSFYHGFMLAADSLTKAGFNAEVYIYDTQKDTNVIATILNKPEFNSIDLIVGPFYPKTINYLTNYSKNTGTPLVIPFKSKNDVLYQNPNIYKATASNFTLVEGMIDYIVDNHSQHYVTMIKPSSVSDLALFEIARQRFNDNEININTNSKIVELTFGNSNGRDINIKLRKDTVNIVVVPSTDLKFVSGVFTRLNNVLNLNPYAKNMKIIVFGFEDWNNLDDLDLKHRMRLHQHYASYRYLDYDLDKTNKMILSFRNKYSTDPDEYGVQGFDVGYYFLSALHLYGSDFGNYIHNHSLETVQNNFSFGRKEEGGRENLTARIIEYSNYQLILKE
jgi:LysM repeat protein